MLYYLAATFLPIDKIVGRLYPVFGLCLIVMALGVGGATLLFHAPDMPELTLPAAFMTAVSATYFLQAPECLGLSAAIASPVGILAAAACTALYAFARRKL